VTDPDAFLVGEPGRLVVLFVVTEVFGQLRLLLLSNTHEFLLMVSVAPTL